MQSTWLSAVRDFISYRMQLGFQLVLHEQNTFLCSYKQGGLICQFPLSGCSFPIFENLLQSPLTTQSRFSGGFGEGHRGRQERERLHMLLPCSLVSQLGFSSKVQKKEQLEGPTMWEGGCCLRRQSLRVVKGGRQIWSTVTFSCTIHFATQEAVRFIAFCYNVSLHNDFFSLLATSWNSMQHILDLQLHPYMASCWFSHSIIWYNLCVGVLWK